MKKFKVENIFVFGKDSRTATETDLGRIVSNPTNEYHILRHYSKLDSSYSNTLIGKEYDYFDYDQQKFKQSVITPEDIETAYQTKGTKFYSHITGIENPTKLIEYTKAELQKLIEKKSAMWIQKSTYEALMFTIDYPVIVGDQDLVSIEALFKQQQSEVKITPRGSHEGEKSIMIKTITGVQKVSTKRISVEINLMSGKAHAFMTAYPSELAPGFPIPSQAPEEYKYSKQFWDSHVFIV